MILGFAIGSTIGVLFAPAKGSETRKKLATNSDDLFGSLKEKLYSFMRQSNEEMANHANRVN